MSLESGKLWLKAVNDEVEIRSLTEEDLEKALDVLDESFFVNESVSIGSEVNLPENKTARLELRELCRQAAADGVSIIAKHIATDKIVAVAFNKIQLAMDEIPFFIKYRNESTKTPQAKSLMDFMISVDSENDVFEKFNLDCVCELMFLAIHPDWERKRIGRALTAATIQLSRDLNKGIPLKELKPSLRHFRPKAVTAIFTSLFSQKIGHALGFQILNFTSYDKFSFAGKTFSQRINPIHKGCEHVIYLL